MEQLRYDMWTAFDCSVNVHPQEQMEKLGYKLINSVPQSIADCWWFTVEDNNIEKPKYIKPMKYNLDYWMHGCYRNCEAFKKDSGVCFGGMDCVKSKGEEQ